MKEAKEVTRSFQATSYISRLKEELPEKDPHLEAEGQVIPRFGYQYRIFKLAEGMRLCVRTTVHTFLPTGYDEMSEEEKKEVEEPPVREYMNVYAFNEVPHKKETPWKASIDTGIAKIFTRQIQDNSCKVQRWIIQSTLAGVDNMKFAFVTREKPSNTQKHLILGTITQKTKAFSDQSNLNMSNCWAVVRFVIEVVLNQQEQTGDYILMKDPNKAMVRLYRRVEDEEEEEDEVEL